MIWSQFNRWFGIAGLAVISGLVFAQQDDDFRWQRGRSVRGADDRGGVPLWEVDADWKQDLFTFARVQYDSQFRGRGGYRWDTDYPDADLNLSFRLQQLTSLKVDPEGKIVRLTDPDLGNYPFLYMIEPGGLYLSDAEAKALRSYLDRGGFLMVDDFWSDREWENFYFEIKRVFPDREPAPVPLSHEIFQMVYPLDRKPLIPSVHSFLRGNLSDRWEVDEANYQAIFDDRGRIMVFICHNTDLGDGWEREGIDRGYFETYSEPYAYPLGINIIVYAMTH